MKLALLLVAALVAVAGVAAVTEVPSQTTERGAQESDQGLCLRKTADVTFHLIQSKDVLWDTLRDYPGFYEVRDGPICPNSAQTEGANSSASE